MGEKYDDRDAFAPPGHVTISGKSFRINAKKLVDYAAIKQRIIDLRPDPMETARENLSDFVSKEDKREFLRACMIENRTRTLVTGHDIGEFIESIDGQMFLIYLAVHETDPAKIRLEDIENLCMEEIRNDTFDQLMKKIENVEARSGNVGGGTATTTSPPQKANQSNSEESAATSSN